jgi:quercetin dioxygenase-like cupin family protein
MRLGLMTAVLGGLFIAVSAVPGVATMGSGFTPTLLGHGRLAHGSLHVSPNGEVVVTKNDVVPGGYSGWHSHPGGAIVVIQSGQITTYTVAIDEEAEDGAASFSCVVTTYTAGQAFIERPGEPLDAVNNGSTPTVIYATFPGVPALGQQRTDRPKPTPDPCPV